MVEQAQSGRPEIQQRREEDLLLQVLPIINDVLTAPCVVELTLGCYLICTILVTKGNLNDKTLDGLMETIAGSLDDDCLNSGIVTLAMIAEERDGAKLPKAVVKSLMMMDNVFDHIITISQQYRVDRLANGLVLKALKQPDASARLKGVDLGNKLLMSGVFDEKQSSKIIRALIEDVNQWSDDLSRNVDLSTTLSQAIQNIFNSPKLGPLMQQALEHISMDVERLEARLNSSFMFQQGGLPAVQEGDSSVDLSTEKTVPSSLENLVEKLPKRLPRAKSFLSKEASALFEQLYQVFAHELSLSNDLTKFKTLELWKQDEDRALLSFYVRIWCGPFPALVKAKALELCTREMEQNEEGDEQVLLPYFLHALGDESARVRGKASQLGLAIQQRSSNEVKNRGAGFRSVVYGQSANNVPWLSLSEFQKVMSAITPKLEECIVDASQISNVIQRALSKSTHGASSEAGTNELHLKSKIRTAFADFLCSHVGIIFSYGVKFRLLKLLGHLDKTVSSSRVRYLHPEVRIWASLTLQEVSSNCNLEQLELGALDSAYVGIVFAKDDGALDLIGSIAQGEIGDGRTTLQQKAFNRINELWSTFSTSSRLSLSNVLLDWSLETSDDQTHTRQTEAVNVLSTVSLSSDILISFLEGIRNPAQLIDKPPAAKKRRTNKTGKGKDDAVDLEEFGRLLRRITFTLHLVESSTSRKQPQLLRSLFHLLDVSQQCKNYTHTDFTYIQTIIISSIFDIVDGTKETMPHEMAEFVRVDLLMDCLRTNSNPQIHNSALLLISSLTTWVPERVLHSIMPVFTFMSRTLLEQSDEYSAHVVDTTVSQVIPPLLESLRKKTEDLSTATAELLSSFVAAYEHVPLHRRLQLFRNLVRNIGPERSLFVVIAMFSDRYAHDSSLQDFVMELVSEFGAVEQIAACHQCLELVLDALQSHGSFAQLILGSKDKSPDQLMECLARILQSLTIILESSQMRKAFIDAKHTKELVTEAQNRYHDLLTKAIELQQADELTKDLQSCSQELETATLGLPTHLDFVESARRLLQESSDGVRHKILLSFEARMEMVDKDKRDDQTRLSTLDFLPYVVQLVKETSTVLLKATAISCVGNIADKYGKTDPDSIFTCAETLVDKQALGAADDNIRTITLLNLAGMVEVLEDRLIPLLPQILSEGFAYLTSTLSADEPNVRLHDAAFRMLTAVTEALPFMLSAKDLDASLTLSLKSSGIVSRCQHSESRQEFVDLLPRKLAPKELFSALLRTWSHAIQEGAEAIEDFFNILKSGIGATSNAHIIKEAPTLFALFSKMFDLRCTVRVEAKDEYPAERIASLEALMHETALAMIYKMNDTVFRPFFIRLVDWASERQADQDNQGRILRSITLFSFCERLFDALKAVVTKYSNYILDHSVQILQQPPPEKGNESDDHSTLVNCTLEALQKSFEHDESEFWQSPAHFEPLCEPLASLLAQTSTNSSDISNVDSSSTKDILIPTIVAFATASSSLEHHRTLNSQLLAHMRSPNVAVRLAAVKTEQALTDRLGEEWLGMLPEMVPYISELQEDDDEVVEKETHRWIQQIEGVLGEGLDGMLQ